MPTPVLTGLLVVPQVPRVEFNLSSAKTILRSLEILDEMELQ